jgi:hypothetical protein
MSEKLPHDHGARIEHLARLAYHSGISPECGTHFETALQALEVK